MKLMQVTAFAAVMILCVGTTFGEVAIREAQLKWEDVATLDGGVVFDNLCAVCHGAGGQGDGPAVSALEHAVPDLTMIAANNGGVYPHERIKNVIFGRHRGVAHGSSGMPYWGEHFMYLPPGRSGINDLPNRSYAWERAHTLSSYVESLQVK